MARLCIEAQANRQYPKSTRRCSYEKYIKLGFETWEVIHETHAHALGPKKMCTPPLAMSMILCSMKHSKYH